MRTKIYRAVGYVGFAALLGCASNQSAVDAAEESRRNADHQEAFQLLHREVSKNPNDPELNQLYWQARIDFLMARGRELVFANQDQQAIQVFHQVLSHDPNNVRAQQWLRKAQGKMAHRAVLEGDKLRGGGDLEGALEQYYAALTYVPENRLAQEGIDAVAELWEKRRDKAQGYYIDGVRALEEQLYGQTIHHLDRALSSDPDLTKAVTPRERAARRRAEQELEDAQKMAAEGFFRPALRELQRLKTKFPPNDEIDATIAWLEREVEAQEIAEQAEADAFRGKFKQARDGLLTALELTADPGPINDKLWWVTELEVSHEYRLARDQELEYRFEEALAAYQKILERMPQDFMDGDVLARVTDLEAKLRLAAESYVEGVKAQEAGELGTAIQHYRDVLDLHPAYKDTKARLADVEKRQKDAIDTH